MIKLSKKTAIDNWLNDRFDNRQNGVIFTESESNYFETIQDFLEDKDRLLQTPAIYYEAFPEESVSAFLNVLTQELTAKFGSDKFNSSMSLAEITATVGLRMVIIDRSYLQPLDALYDILNQLAICSVGTILIGSHCKLKISGILEHPNLERWEKLILDDWCEISPKIN